MFTGVSARGVQALCTSFPLNPVVFDVCVEGGRWKLFSQSEGSCTVSVWGKQSVHECLLSCIVVL